MRLITFSIWTCLFFLSPQLVANDKLIKIVDDNTFSNPALNSSYFIDNENALNIYQILQPKYQNIFIANTSEIPNYGLVSSTIWMKFSIQSLLDVPPYLEIDNPALDTIEYFLCNTKGKIVHHITMGNFVKIEDRSLLIGDMMIDMKLEKNKVYSCYIKVNSRSSSVLLPMRIASLNKYYDVRHKESVLQGLYFGLILFLFIYNVFLFFSLRDSTYIYFALFIGSIGAMFAIFKGFGMQYIWNSFLHLNQLAPLIGAASGIFIILFTAKFLNSKTKTPKLHTWLFSLIVFYLLVIVLNLAGIQYLSAKLLDYNTALALIFILFVAIKGWKEGFIPAKYFLFAWSFYIIGFTIFSLRESGWITTNFFAANILQISSTATILFMSFALSKRINIYIDKKNEAQILALKTAVENEMLFSNENQLLEAKVSQRTEDLEQTIATLSKQSKDLNDANAFKDKVLSIISHDLKSPISTLAGLLMLMKTKSLNEKEQGKVVQSLDLALKSTKILLDNILAWAHKNNQKETDEIELHELVEEIFHLFKYPAELKKIVLKNEIEKGFFIEANKNMLQLVLRNLVSNAIKFTEKNGQVEICMKQDFLNLYVFVKDNGIGMSEDVVSKLFKPNNLMSTRGTENEKGTGLGLKLCKEFIEKHDGYLEVESKIGNGSTFTLKLKNVVPILETVFN